MLSLASCFLQKKSGTGQAPLSRETSYATRVALQHCPALHMSKRKYMIDPTKGMKSGKIKLCGFLVQILAN